MFRRTRQTPDRPARAASKSTSDVTDGLNPVWRIPHTIQIQGELSAETDVAIDGGFDGDVTLGGNRLILGASGRLNGDVRAGSMLVRGAVQGDITVEDVVTITRTGSVRGNIRARRVRLREGCSVRGRVHQGPAVNP